MPRTRGRDRLAAVLRRAGPTIAIDDVVASLNLDRVASAKLLSRWADQGWLKSIRRGLYAPVPLDADPDVRAVGNPWLLVPRLFGRAYVGGWSAAEHWDLTEQVFRDICVFSTKRVRATRQNVESTTFVVRKIGEHHFFGTSPVWEGNTRIEVSDPHRTIVDMLAWPQAAGGIDHAAMCLTAYVRSKHCDLKRVITYAKRLETGVIFKRLGFLLESLGRFPDAVRECESRLTAGYSKLDPALPGDHIVTRWKLWLPKDWSAPSDRSA